jgi:hypothetical protein
MRKKKMEKHNAEEMQPQRKPLVSQPAMKEAATMNAFVS